MVAKKVEHLRVQAGAAGGDLLQIVQDGIGDQGRVDVGEQVRAKDDVPAAGAVGPGAQDGVVAEGGEATVEGFGDLAGGFRVGVIWRRDDGDREAHGAYRRTKRCLP